jgi:hypothetical protein
MSHQNNGNCPKCAEIFNRFPNVNHEIRSWFESFQAKHPEAHISGAGRGKAEQEQKVREGKSRAHWGASAHNYNCAVDIFEMSGKPKDIYEEHWFQTVLKPNLTSNLKWYGEPGSSFYELPHVELRAWRELKAKGLIKLVE